MAQSDKSPSELIDQRIEELGDWRGDLLAEIRALVKQADPDIVDGDLESEPLNLGHHICGLLEV